MRKITFILVTLFIITGTVGAQQVLPIPDIRTCATMEEDSILRAKYPNYGSLDELEIAIQKKIKQIEEKRRSGRFEQEIITIPIIFHVVHNGENLGTGSNISQEQIQAQIEVLNEDFRRLSGSNGFNDHPDGADIEIEFCLASVDEDGNEMAEPGVDRVLSNRSAWTRQAIEGELKPLTIWNPNFYYNVWTVTFDTEDELLLGYAQFPGQSGLSGLNENGGPASTDGVVVRYSVVGSAQKGNFPVMQAPYNLGRTMVHETGHWLGLRHIWGDGPCNADDFCDDTPSASGPHRGCPRGTVSCDSQDMVENYMDYSDDACMNIFTRDQKTRILAVMELSPRRGILKNSMVCGETVAEAPVPNFTADKTEVLSGGVVKFTDLSGNFPTSWQWTFEGGSPATSTERNPNVTYNDPGQYTVSLVATNSIGSSELLEFTGYITVSSEGLCNELSNFGDGTPTLFRAPQEEKGFLAGHNSRKTQAISEFFNNDLGYVELSGVTINFGYAQSDLEDAVATVVVWNALGPQNAPSRILEEKDVLIKQISEDITNNRKTYVSFNRRVPIFLGTSFHVGIRLEHNGDSLAIITTANGESTKQTSWEQDSEGIWSPYSLSWGVNVAHDITPSVGMKPSVHIAPSALSVFPSQEVTLNASGASIFLWNSTNGELVDQLGPQVKVRPRQTTTYTVQGSGIDLCEEETSFTVFVKVPPLETDEILEEEITLFPNPVSEILKLNYTGAYRGNFYVQLINNTGQKIIDFSGRKNDNTYRREIDVSEIPTGVYVLQMTFKNQKINKKVIIR